MPFELAKELKDAGFDQNPRIDISGVDGPFFGGFYFICKRDLSQPSGIAVGEVASRFLDQYMVISYTDSDDVLVKIPQLSELIEACGEGFFQLQNFFDVGVWVASIMGCIDRGPTPEEAAAHLWLALKTN